MAKRSTSPRPVPDEVTAYIESLPEDRRGTVRAIHEMIRGLAPEYDVALYGRIIGYGRYDYRYASGRSGTWFTLGLANNKANVALYACVADGDSYLAEARADRLAAPGRKVSVGRSCIRFKRLEDLDLDEVSRLVTDAVRLGGMGAYRA